MFNLCDLWLTKASYQNKRLLHESTGTLPMFLEPCMFHFTKDEAFGLFTSEIVIGNSGVNLESATYNGFECYNQELSWFVCLRHLKKVMKKKCLSCCRKQTNHLHKNSLKS